MIIVSRFRVGAVTLLVLQMTILTACCAMVDSSDTIAYGAKVKFRVGRALHFSDFEMTYIGKRRVTPPQYPRGWWIHDFKVRSKEDEQTVSWSAGTGDIGPVGFKVNGSTFQIELSHSDRLGRLLADEMVVSTVK